MNAKEAGARGPARSRWTSSIIPGEWLLDLALLDAATRNGRARRLPEQSPERLVMAAGWHEALASFDPAGSADEMMAARTSEAFKQYLMVLRADDEAVATTPPGRFLMPGDLAGSPP